MHTKNFRNKNFHNKNFHEIQKRKNDGYLNCLIGNVFRDFLKFFSNSYEQGKLSPIIKIIKGSTGNESMNMLIILPIKCKILEIETNSSV